MEAIEAQDYNVSAERTPAIAYLTAYEYQPTKSGTGSPVAPNVLAGSYALPSPLPANYPPEEQLGYVVDPTYAQTGWHVVPYKDAIGQELANGSFLIKPAESAASGPRDLWISDPSAAEGRASPSAASPIGTADGPHGSSKRCGGSTTVTCFQLLAAYVMFVLAGIFVLFLLLASRFWPPRQGITTTTVRIETFRNEFGYINPSA
ncbi:hypothetical protein MTO96_037038, partial [Rhipicephalus appendiculatus]